MTGTEILALAPNSWHGPWMNRQQLLSRLATSHQILYSTGALSVWDRNKPEWTSAPWLPEFTSSDGVIVDIPGRIPLRWPRQAAVDSVAMRFYARRWRKRLSIKHAEMPILYVFHPKFARYVKYVPASKLVYHAYDSFELTPDWNGDLERAQNWMLREADLVVASSTMIAARLKARGRLQVEVITNGVDFQSFNTRHARSPGDTVDIPHPRIGYVGRVNRKIDLGLLDELARSRPEWSLIIVGPIAHLDEETSSAFESLRSLKNVFLLGQKSHLELPSYVQNLDVGLLPYRIGIGSWTQAGYPLKLHEYLAAGLPTIASDLPSLREFGDVIDIVPSTRDAWMHTIASALAGDSAAARAKRIAVARQNDWDIGATSLCQLLQAGKR